MPCSRRGENYPAQPPFSSLGAWCTTSLFHAIQRKNMLGSPLLYIHSNVDHCGRDSVHQPPGKGWRSHSDFCSLSVWCSVNAWVGWERWPGTEATLSPSNSGRISALILFQLTLKRPHEGCKLEKGRRVMGHRLPSLLQLHTLTSSPAFRRGAHINISNLRNLQSNSQCTLM